MVSRQALHERARRQGDFTDAQWQELLIRYDHRCAYCGKKDVPLIQEHQIPVSRGGRHKLANVVPACTPCNVSKSDRTPGEFAEYLECRRLPKVRPEKREYVWVRPEGMAPADRLTVTEVAALLGIGGPGVRWLVAKDKLHPERPSPRVLLFDRAEVERYARERRPRGRPGKGDACDHGT